MELQKYDFKKNLPLVLCAFLVVLSGVGSAWLISGNVWGKTGSKIAAPGVKASSTEAGKLDPSIKYDSATGIIREGGIGNEGTHHLEREGGPSQTVYLTSSMVDLQGFVDKKVEIWGETQSSKKAGWLMDVAKIKVIE